jgi:hypothetical protein
VEASVRSHFKVVSHRQRVNVSVHSYVYAFNVKYNPVLFKTNNEEKMYDVQKIKGMFLSHF